MKFISLLLLMISTLFADAHYSENSEILKKKARETKDLRQKFVYYDELFLNHYYHHGNTDTICKTICKEMETLAIELNNDSLLARCYVLYDVYYSSSNDYNLAFQYIQKAIETGKRAHYWNVVSSAYKEYATLYKDAGIYNVAIDHLRISESYLQNKYDSLSYIQPNRLYYNLAECFMRLSNYDSAIKYIRKTEEVTDPASDPYGYAKFLNTKAIIYSSKPSDDDLTNTFFSKSIALCLNEKLYLPLIISCADYSDYLYARNSINQSKYYAIICFHYADSIKSKVILIRASDRLKEIYEKESKSDSLLIYLRLSDSLRNMRSIELRNNQIINAIRESDKTIAEDARRT